MRPVKTYLLHLFILTLLTLVLDLCLSGIFHIHWWQVYLQAKTYFITDLFACLSLFLLNLKSTKSVAGTIIICLLCCLFTVILGYGMAYLNIWYSNIPLLVIMNQKLGVPLLFAKILASVATCTFTAFNTIRSVSKMKKSPSNPF